MELRAAVAAHGPFLLDMLVKAFNWTGEQRITRGQIEAERHLAHYVAGWPRMYDFGVVASDNDGRLTGAAWARTFTAEDPGYGFVSDEVPEISMAVVAVEGQGG